jgi:hypothetical protein
LLFGNDRAASPSQWPSGGNLPFSPAGTADADGRETRIALFGSSVMKKYEAFTGAAVWMAVTLLMAAAALEPVEVQAQTLEAPAVASGTCGDGAAELAMGCESIHL